jgi:transcriptional regulator with XRE-family HTH domain
MDLAEQLREAVKASGRSLGQLARESGVDPSRLSRFLRGERDLTLEATGKLCGVLGLTFCPVEAPPATPAKRKRGKGK